MVERRCSRKGFAIAIGIGASINGNGTSAEWKAVTTSRCTFNRLMKTMERHGISVEEPVEGRQGPNKLLFATQPNARNR